MDSRKRALSMARQSRLCPPARILSDPKHEKEVERHLATCPYCHELSVGEISPWDDLADSLRGLITPIRNKGKEPALEKGCVCRIKAEKGRWWEGNFYTPPMVLMLERSGVIDDEVLVAQVYHDAALAGPGDLILEKGRSPVGEIFIEAWNTYTLRLRDLTPPLGKVSPRVLFAARRLGEDQALYPRWAAHPRPMAQEDQRIYFREMEVEVGFVFSSAAVAELMNVLERRSLRLVYGAPREAMAAIGKRQQGIFWEGEPSSLEQVLASARFPPECYTMAAASNERELFPANLVEVTSGKVARIAPVEGEILERNEEAGGLAIGGRVAIPEGVEIFELLCFLETGDGAFLSPEVLEWDQGVHFRARFPVTSTQGAELFVAALLEA